MSKRVIAQDGDITVNPITGVVELYYQDNLVAQTAAMGSGALLVDKGSGLEEVVVISEIPSIPVGTTGTPVDNQIAVWTDATTIEGDASLTWDGSTASLTLFNTGDTDSAVFRHDGTDFNTSLTNTTDWNITGLTTNLNLDAGLLVDGNVEIDGSGWGIFPNRLGAGTVPNLTAAPLQVLGDFHLKSGGIGLVNSSNVAENVISQSGSTDQFAKIRNYLADATLWEVRSQSGVINTDNREATLVLTRTDESGNEEFLDFYNNGYPASGDKIAEVYGIRIQKRGTGTYRPFYFDWYDGTTDTDGIIVLSPDDAGGPSFGFKQDTSVSATFSVFDSGETDSGAFSHDGTDFLFDFTNTAAVDFTGQDTINFGDPGNESGSVTLNGVSYDAVAKINEFGGTNDATLILHRHADSAAVSANMLLSRSRGNTSTHSNVVDGDMLGRLLFAGYYSTSYYQAASIKVSVDGTPGAADMPSVLELGTTPDGAQVPIDYVKLRPDGAFEIYDAGETDYGAFSHDGTDFNTAFTNTTDWNITGADVVLEGLTVGSLFSLSVDVEDQLTANQSDYTPTGWATATMLALQTDGSDYSIDGFGDGTQTEGMVLVIQNFDGSNSITIVDSGTSSSSAGNRIICPGGTDVTLGPKESAIIIYKTENTFSRWRVIGLAQVPSAGGGTPTAITVADESSDTTCFPAFFTAATGDLGPKTNASLTFNSSTGALAATSFSGSGASLTSLTAANIASGNLGSGVLPFATASGTSSAFKVPFVNTTGTSSGNFGLLIDSTATFTYNPSTNTLVAGTFSGSGASLTALNAGNISTGTLAVGRGGTGVTTSTGTGSTVRSASPTFTGTVIMPTTATGGASFRSPHGTAPTTPTNGDIWTTTSGLFVRVNGSTVGPLTANTGTGNVSNTGTPVNNQLAVWTNSTTIEGDAGLTFDSAGTFAIIETNTLQLIASSSEATIDVNTHSALNIRGMDENDTGLNIEDGASLTFEDRSQANQITIQNTGTGGSSSPLIVSSVATLPGIYFEDGFEVRLYEGTNTTYTSCIQDTGGATWDQSNSGDTHDFAIAGNVRFSISNTTLSATSANLDMNDNSILMPVLQDYAIESASVTVSSNTATLTYSNGPAFELDLEAATGTVTVTISGGPPAGTYGQLTVKVQQDSTADRTITWAGGTFVWAGGSVHDPQTGSDAITIYTFETWNAGSTWYAAGADYS